MVNKDVIPDNVLRLTEKIGAHVYTKISALTIEAWVTNEPVPFYSRYSGEYRQLHMGSCWGGLFDCAWMRFTATLPDIASVQQRVVLVDVGGEGLVVDKFGAPVCGITNKASSWGVPPDKPGKWAVDATFLTVDDEIEFWVDAGCNDLFGYVQNGGAISDAWFGLCHQELKNLYYDVEILLDWIKVHDASVSIHPKGVSKASVKELSAKSSHLIVYLLNLVDSLLISFSDEEISAARKLLQRVLSQPSDIDNFTITATGHAHLDIAWMWPIREGRRKAARTFATALLNLDSRPDYLFGASQYQLFDWIRIDYPLLFERIKKHVHDGRFELQGCFWVECDLNLVSGESLIRQIMFGLDFTQKHFGRQIEYVWQPDVFGFTGSLPQILVKSGVKYVASQKLSQNKINRFPHHLFRWRGIDGSEVIMHNFPEEKYDSSARAKSAQFVMDNFLEKDIYPGALMVYGVGDGGGGPGEEHIERVARIKNIAGLPPVKHGRVDAFFHDVESYRNQLPVLSGELYFEAHQGCFTTESTTKIYNASVERALHDAEFFSAIDGSEKRQDIQIINGIWKQLLTLQFHDILPGSSIARVHHETVSTSRKLLDECNSLIKKKLNNLISRLDTRHHSRPFVVFNTIPFERHEWLLVDDQWMKVCVDSLGYQLVERKSHYAGVMKAESCILENSRLRLTFSQDGDLVSYYDKLLDKEFIPRNSGSTLIAWYENAGFFAAWDFADNYREGPSERLRASKITAKIDGPTAVMNILYEYKNSFVQLSITLTQDSSRVDFHTEIDWKEPDVSLKMTFPVSIHTRAAHCQIQFGVIERPTHSDDSYALAMDEIPAQHWVDISDDTGMALISDNKYGFRVKERCLELTLLRSQRKPGAEIGIQDDSRYLQQNFADIGWQSFIFALYSHAGDYREGNVVSQGYKLRYPLYVIPVQRYKGELPDKLSFFHIDQANIVLETIKLAESGQGIVVRFYESHGQKTECLFSCHVPDFHACHVDLMERALTPLNRCNGNMRLQFKPFEIITLFLQL